MKKISMAEIARKCGVSKATVSRALADDPRVKPETKAYIKEVARRYNYRPHAVASNLARGRSKTIGMMLPAAPRTIADPFFLEYLNGVSTVLFEHGYSMLLPQVSPNDVQETITSLSAQGRVDGVVLTEPRLDDPRIEFLKNSRIPFVFLGSTNAPDVSWVDGDNIGGAYSAVQELYRLGHRRIAIITGEEGLVSTANRCRGYEHAMADLGLAVDPDLVWHGDFTREGAYRVVRERLMADGGMNATAIFASNDLMAIGAIQALHEAGLRVPEDVSVIGFDGVEVGKYLTPPLTTVQQPIHELGRQVAYTLLGLLEEGKRCRQITLPVRLVNPGNTAGRNMRK
ncbi:MAG: LacI family transcriptional regulator [Firmicutes bacterium]|nr:LacI family transcriptional regulator [Bacillota bacterium]